MKPCFGAIQERSQSAEPLNANPLDHPNSTGEETSSISQDGPNEQSDLQRDLEREFEADTRERRQDPNWKPSRYEETRGAKDMQVDGHYNLRSRQIGTITTVKPEGKRKREII
jgi:hypothetical protein